MIHDKKYFKMVSIFGNLIIFSEEMQRLVLFFSMRFPAKGLRRCGFRALQNRS